MATPLLRHPTTQHRWSRMRLLGSEQTQGNAPGICLPPSACANVILLPTELKVAIAPLTFVCPITAERWLDSACARSATKLHDSCAWCPAAKLSGDRATPSVAINQ